MKPQRWHIYNYNKKTNNYVVKDVLKLFFIQPFAPKNEPKDS